MHPIGDVHAHVVAVCLESFDPCHGHQYVAGAVGHQQPLQRRARRAPATADRKSMASPSDTRDRTRATTAANRSDGKGFSR